MDRIKVGKAAEHIFIAKCLLAGIECYLPASGGGKVDMVIGNHLVRCQVKAITTTQPRALAIRKCGCNSRSNVKVYRYTNRDIDFMVGVDMVTFDFYPIHIDRLDDYVNYISLPELIRAKVKNDFSAILAFDRVKELAGEYGVEPQSSELEAEMLPLHHSPVE